MNAEELKALQAPIKDHYRKQPQAALVTLRAQGRMGEGIACRVDTGRATIEAGLHPATGGSGLQDAQLTAEGDLDFRGTLGVAKDAPVGFPDMRLRFHLDTDAPAEQQKKLIELTERYCVVLQTLRQGPAIKIAS